MIRRPPRSTLSSSSAASDVYKRQVRGRGGRRRPEGQRDRAREREGYEGGEDRPARVRDEAASMLGREEPEEERERPRVVEGDGAEIARDRSQEEARDLGARERERLEDATPDRESGDRFRVSSQDEA